MNVKFGEQVSSNLNFRQSEVINLNLARWLSRQKTVLIDLSNYQHKLAITCRSSNESVFLNVVQIVAEYQFD